MEKLRRAQTDEEKQHVPETREVADKPPMSLEPTCENGTDFQTLVLGEAID